MKQAVFLIIPIKDQNWEKTEKVQRYMFQFRDDGTFGIPGGKVEEGETIEEGLKREISEEIGFKFDPRKVRPLTVDHNEGGGEVTIFLYENNVKMDVLKACDMQFEECKGILALTLDEVKKLNDAKLLITPKAYTQIKLAESKMNKVNLKEIIENIEVDSSEVDIVVNKINMIYQNVDDIKKTVKKHGAGKFVFFMKQFDAKKYLKKLNHVLGMK